MSYQGQQGLLESLRLTPQSADPSNPVQGQLYYSDGTARPKGLYAYKDGVWSETGAGSSTIRYIDENFEASVDSLVVYNDSAASDPTRPDDATGGSVTTELVVSAETTSPLVGTQSARISKDAVNRQGFGAAILSDTVDLAYSNSVHTVEFLWKADDGNYAAGDVSLWVVHPTTGTVEALNFRTALGEYTNELPTTGSSGTRILSELTPIDDTYRVVVHVGSTSATAWDVDVDDIKVGPQRLLPGIYQNSATLDLTGSGDFTGGEVEVVRVGDMVTVSVSDSITHASTNQASSASGFLPTWARPTQNKTNLYNSSSRIDRMVVTTAGLLSFNYYDNTLGSANSTSASQLGTISYTVDDDRGNNLIGTSQLDQQSVYATCTVSTNKSGYGTSPTTIDFDEVVTDPFNLFSAADNGFTVPVSGTYMVGYSIDYSSLSGNGKTTESLSGSTIGNILTTDNGAAQSNWTSSGSTIVDLPKDEVLTMTTEDISDTSYNVTTNSRFWIMRIPDFTVFGTFPEKNLVQTKTLAQDVTVDASDISTTTGNSDFRFDNLTIGKWYNVTGIVAFVGTSSTNDNGVLRAVHNSNVLNQVSVATFANNFGYRIPISFKFKAEASTLTFESLSLTDMRINGDGTRSETHVQLEERNDLRETDKF